MVETFKKPKLEKGKTYRVEQYPEEEILESIYLGLSEREHVFKIKSNGFIIAEDHWIMEANGIITYMPISSSGIRKLTKDSIQIFSDQEKSRLLKILADVGSQL